MMTSRDEMHTTNKVNYTSKPILIMRNYTLRRTVMDDGDMFTKTLGSEHLIIPEKSEIIIE